MIRPGHHRPLGTTARMRFATWEQDRLPQLGDVACQSSSAGANDQGHVRRCYVVVGIEEGRTPRSLRLVMERVEYGTLPDSLDPDALWSFYNLPR